MKEIEKEKEGFIHDINYLKSYDVLKLARNGIKDCTIKIQILQKLRDEN